MAALRSPRELSCLPGFFCSSLLLSRFPPPPPSLSSFWGTWDAASLLQAFLGSFCAGSLKSRLGFKVVGKRKERMGKVSYPLPKALGEAAEPPSPKERKTARLEGRHRSLAVC